MPPLSAVISRVRSAEFPRPQRRIPAVPQRRIPAPGIFSRTPSAVLRLNFAAVRSKRFLRVLPTSLRAESQSALSLTKQMSIGLFPTDIYKTFNLSGINAKGKVFKNECMTEN